MMHFERIGAMHMLEISMNHWVAMIVQQKIIVNSFVFQLSRLGGLSFCCWISYKFSPYLHTVESMRHLETR